MRDNVLKGENNHLQGLNDCEQLWETVTSELSLTGCFNWSKGEEGR